MSQTALLVVDATKTFGPEGEIPSMDPVVEPIARLMRETGLLKVNAHEVHPPHHVSFQSSYARHFQEQYLHDRPELTLSALADLLALDTKRIFEASSGYLRLNDELVLTKEAIASGLSLSQLVNNFVDHQTLALWPDHSLAENGGTDMLKGIPDVFDLTVIKSTKVNLEQHGAFWDFAGHHTKLDQNLRQRGIDTIVVAGYIGPVCVGTTVQQALALGYQVVWPRDAVAAYDQAWNEQMIASLACDQLTVVDSF